MGDEGRGKREEGTGNGEPGTGKEEGGIKQKTQQTYVY
jgi:hypothetical protein